MMCNHRYLVLTAALASMLGACAHSQTSEWASRAAANEHGRAPGIERLQTECDGGDGRACVLLGLVYRGTGRLEGVRVDKDAGRAAKLFLLACEAGLGQGCVLAAEMSALGEGAPADLARAAQLHRRGCDAGDLAGCTALGNFYLAGKGVARDPQQGLKLLEHACNQGELSACGDLGVVALQRAKTERDQVRAMLLVRRACEGGSTKHCQIKTQCPNNNCALSAITNTGQDQVKAALYLEQACADGNAAACENAGNLYWGGTAGMPKDPARAVALYKRACAGRPKSGACNNLGISYLTGVGTATDVKTGVALLERECTRGNSLGCRSLGVAYRNGVGVGRELARALPYFKRACHLGDKPSCATY